MPTPFIIHFPFGAFTYSAMEAHLWQRAREQGMALGKYHVHPANEDGYVKVEGEFITGDED